MPATTPATKRTMVGTVVSDKMDKTIVVRVDSTKRHPKYKKTYRTSKKFKAHDEQNEFHVGDRVEIAESAPISRDKHFRAVKKI
jgi:small subunit ribosomal protein S17